MPDTKYQPVEWLNQVISVTSFGKRFESANTIVFTNQGTQAVTIDGNLQIQPGQGFTYECYPGEINVHGYDIVFTNDQAAGCRLLVTIKLYSVKE